MTAGNAAGGRGITLEAALWKFLPGSEAAINLSFRNNDLNLYELRTKIRSTGRPNFTNMNKNTFYDAIFFKLKGKILMGFIESKGLFAQDI